MITLYDISSSVPQKAFASNPWKTRYCLNFKGVPYKTEFVEFPEIEGVYNKLGIEPTGKRPDGSPYYSLPVIHDSSTGVTVADSWKIAEYLEKTYPSPPLFPDNTLPFQELFEESFRQTTLKEIRTLIIPHIFARVNPESKDFFRRTRESAFGKPLEEIAPKGEEAVAAWAEAKKGWLAVDNWYKKTFGAFLLGHPVSWADFVVGGWLMWLRTVLGEDSPEWKEIALWHDGRWVRFLNNLKPYEKVV